jgi:hypothetical protein
MATLPPMPPPISLKDYTDEYITGYPGDLADIGLKDTISRQNTGTTNIPFGAAVQDGPAMGQNPGCQAFSGGRVIGFAKSDYALHPVPGGLLPPNAPAPNQVLQYLPGDTVQIIRDARMREQAPVNVTRGMPVTVDSATGIVNSGGTAVPGCTWETDTNAGDIGIIQILIP